VLIYRFVQAISLLEPINQRNWHANCFFMVSALEQLPANEVADEKVLIAVYPRLE
jgi:hypothetical protein